MDETGDDPRNDPGAARESLDLRYLRTSYERHLGAVYRVIFARVGNREEAEDLTAQVFLTAVRDRDRAGRTASIRTWLLRLAQALLADRERAIYHRFSPSLSQLTATSEHARDTPRDILLGDNGMRQHRLREADDELLIGERVQWILAHLPLYFREVLECRFLLNLSLDQTAARMRLSEKSVQALQFQALQMASRVVRASDTAGSARTTRSEGGLD